MRLLYCKQRSSNFMYARTLSRGIPSDRIDCQESPYQFNLQKEFKIGMGSHLTSNIIVSKIDSMG